MRGKNAPTYAELAHRNEQLKIHINVVLTKIENLKKAMEFSAKQYRKNFKKLKRENEWLKNKLKYLEEINVKENEG